MIKLLSILIAIASIGAAAQLSISLPESVSAVPITAQSLVVLLIAKVQKWPLSFFSVILYLLLGIIGLPLFADFQGGWAVFSGNSLGYFIGFLVAVWVVSQMAKRQSNRFSKTFVQLLVGSLIILLFGFLALLRFVDIETAWTKGVYPFLPGALIKVLVGSILLSAYRRFKQFMQEQNFQ